MNQTFSEWRTAFHSRLEIRRRKRKLDGPGTATIIFRELILGPTIDLFGMVRDYAFAYVRAAVPFSQASRGEGSDANARRRTWRDMECDQRRVQLVTALIALVTVMLAISANELQFRGYVPAWDEDCANPEVQTATCFVNPCSYSTPPSAQLATLTCPATFPNEATANSIKMSNTVLTLLLFLSIYAYYRYEADILSLRNHVEFKQPLKIHTLSECGLLNHFFIQLLLSAVHQALSLPSLAPVVKYELGTKRT